MGIRTRRRAVAAVLAVVALAACGPDAEEPAADATTSSSASVPLGDPHSHGLADATGTPAAATRDVTIELLGAGAEPRQVLRLDPEAGHTSGLEMRMKMDTTIAIDGADRGGVEQVLSTMEGRTGTLTTTRSGAFVEGDARPPRACTPPWPAHWSSSSSKWRRRRCRCPPTPSAPGPGGESAPRSASTGSRPRTRPSTSSVRCRTGRTSWPSTSNSASCPAQIEQAGAVVQVIEGRGTGSGTVTGSLDFPLAVEGRTQMTTSMVAQLSGQGQSQRMEQEVSMQVEMTPR